MRQAIMHLQKLTLPINLGWTKSERISLQEIDIDIILRFPQPPLACQSDKLQETICYAELIEKITAAISNRSFKLIEHLAFFLHQMLTALVPNQTKIMLSIHKNPAIAELKGGVRFCYGDE